MHSIGYYFSKLNIPKTLWGIFIIALILRFWGIWYGLPLQLNVDEPSLVSGTLSIKHNLNPGRFDWPSLYFYINAAFYGAFALIKPILTATLKIPDDSFSPAAFFLISRSLSAVLGSLTVIVVFMIGRKIFSHRVGMIAALLLTFLPVHVLESHLAKVDIAHTFFVALAVYFIWDIYKKGNKWSYIMSGILIGIATSIKYNSFLLAISVLQAYLMRRSESQEADFIKKYFDWKSVKYMLLAGLLSIVVFYMGSPFALFDYKTFFSTERGQGAMWQFQNLGKVEWADYPAEVYETFVTMFQNDLGYIIWILFSVLLLLFLFFNKRSKAYNFLLFPTILISLYITRLDRSPSHYFLMLIPFYIPAIAAFVNEIYNWMTGMKYLKFIPLNIFLLFILAPSIWSVLKSDYMLSREDTRNLAYNWVIDNIDPEKDFLFVMGEDLAVVEYQRNNTEQIKKLDKDGIHYKEAPFFVVIGVDGVKKEQLTEGDRDPGNLEGNSEPILKYADLLFYAENENRFGPPIYIFKVNQVEPDGD
jgi:hypothetical protein